MSVKFTLNEKGGNLLSEATVVSEYNSLAENARFFNFTKPFVLFMKEENKSKPYFSLKVDNVNILEIEE